MADEVEGASVNKTTGSEEGAGEDATLLGGGEPSEESADKSAKKEPSTEKVDEEADKKDEKPSEDKSGKDKSEEDEKSKGAPDEYETFKMPEGVEVDEEAMGDFKAFAKENDLPQDVAQALVDRYADGIQKFSEKQMQQWAEVREGWVKDAKSRKALAEMEGGFDGALGFAKQAVEKLGGEKLQEVLNVTGAGDNPEVIEAFAKVGQLLSDGKIVIGSSAGDKLSAAERMYPSMRQKK